MSDSNPPNGRATKFTKAKEPATNPAISAVIIFSPASFINGAKTDSKNMGNIETTASSAPKLAKYVLLRAATLPHLYLSFSGTPAFK